MSRILPQGARHSSPVQRFLSKESRCIGRGPVGTIIQNSHSHEGFTLVELMVTVAAFVLLTAVVLPRYLAARDAVLISTMVNQGLTFAKACAIINSTGIGEQPVTGSVDTMRGGITITQGCQPQTDNTGATLEVTWGLARADGVHCLDQRSTLTSQKAVLTVSTNSEITCSFLG